ncbi:MAG: glycosyltransferase [Schwartzia succinivorans]|jgi:glycosyltransferase involved in cell wall biosynthesis|uniref:glycosyltransferase n=1 Tax=Schwartzia succinivorans TaxID=55507 RepID=UPI002352868F|nr:glycosyltransferase [Schwartzia succinivorans]MBE6097680.1 glycosyltransferase [Schwartzia succinivorans]
MLTGMKRGGKRTNMEACVDFYNIPIFIISYNRLNDLQRCVERYQKDGYKNIIILDNASTDEGLKSWLRTLSCKVFFLDENYGHHVLWDCHLFDDVLKDQYYVLTDPDVLPDETCPSNYVEVFYNILQKYPNKTKVGFSLRIDDLPDSYPFKWDCVRYESFYWEAVLPWEFRIYDAQIDTTFALYRPGSIDHQTINTGRFFDGIRTGGLYKARHLGWYWDNISDNKVDMYYHAQNTISTSMSKDAMMRFAYEVITRLSLGKEMPFFSVVSTLASVQYIKKYIGFGVLIKTFSYVLCKLVYVKMIEFFPKIDFWGKRLKSKMLK